MVAASPSGLAGKGSAQDTSSPADTTELPGHEDEVINEAIFGGLGMVLLGKLFVFLFKALQSKDELADLNVSIQQSKVPEEAKEISAKMVDLLNTVEKNAPALEKVAAVTGAGGNLNPLNWKANALIALVKSGVEGIAGKEKPTPVDVEEYPDDEV